ncbi:MAG TPA: bifunctional acetate--CoA ligase family protein/GNAT family N-acetyltransferase [Chlamydiales bacterium]|jgi:acetyltransferase
MEETFDPSMNFLYRRHRQLDHIFQPKRVAVVGASDREGSVGRTVMQNLLQGGLQGEIIPINPKRPEVLGVKAYPDLKSVPGLIELVVIITPAKTVPALIAEAADLKIPAAIIISAGFKEMGEPGIALEQEILKHARRSNMRVIGPNCLGVMNPNTGLNATFAADMAHKGQIAFISQSGALCTAVLDWSLREKVGFSAFVSIGSMLDVGWGDLINYFGNDPWTKSILIYMESIGDARAFLSAAREVALTKPIILIKAGRSSESAKAAASHTGALAGSDEAMSAALKRVGVLRVDTIDDLFSMAQALAKQPRPKGPCLTIVTNAGGPGVIATDALVAEGGKLTELSSETFSALNALLPAQWSRNNPIDVLGDANAELYAKTIEIALKEPASNGTLVILTPQDMTDSTGTAEKLALLEKADQPMFASWMGADHVQQGIDFLTNAGIPNFEFPDAACKTFARMWQYTEQLRSIYETPTHVPSSAAHHKLEKIFSAARKEGRTLLDEYESKKVLEAYNIPTVPTHIATSAEEAVRVARELGFPIVLKLYSRTITHKTDVGGVKLNLTTEEAVKKAYEEIHASVDKLAGKSHFQGVTVQPMVKLDGYELIIGSSLDEQFGPVMLFGSGGQLVEVFKDRALAIPPLTTTLAKRLMEQTKIFEALKGVRGRSSINLEALEEILVRFSQLITEQPWIKECDINPLLASPSKLIALDARIVLHEPGLKESELPKPAIRPYPNQYIQSFILKNGTSLTIRPIRPDDEKLIVRFHQDLSQETVRQRYLKAINYEERIAHDRLVRICFNDYTREIALVAIAEKTNEIVGVARLTKLPSGNDASFALVVKDAFQNQGVGSKLMSQVLSVAKAEGIQMLAASLLEENFQMQKLLKGLGFEVRKEGEYLLATKGL